MNQEEITKVFEKISASDMEGLLHHLEAQKAEMAALNGKNEEEMVKFYLDYKAKVNQAIAAVYPKNPQGKTTKDCLVYIKGKAQKLKVGNCAMIHHSIVFDWAEEYFLDDTIKKTEHKATPKPATPKEKKLSKEEMAAKINEWQAEHQKKVADWTAEHEKKISEWKDKHPLDLFGQRPECPDEKATCPFLNDVCPYKIEDAADDAPKNEDNQPTAQTPTVEADDNNSDDPDEEYEPEEDP